MDHDLGRSNRKKRVNQRDLRSISSPSVAQNQPIEEPQRAQSLAFIGGEIEQNHWQTSTIQDYTRNVFLSYEQERWNYNNCPILRNSGMIFLNPNVYPTPSTSGISEQNFESRGFSTSQYQTRQETVPVRTWEPEKPINDKNKKFLFTVMSYNVLAQDLVEGHMYLYKNHDPTFLSWNVRWTNILKEIREADADIICFQEVQESHIAEYFNDLDHLGYRRIYKKRTGIRTDGCAIYYRIQRLRLLECEKIEYFQENISILNRDNVGIVARFVPKEANMQAFVVATTHLLYNPNRQDVRLAQMQYLMTEIDKMAFLGTNSEGKSSYLPIILTGDLNATPDSALYEFISKGMLRYEHLSANSLSRDGGRGPTGKILIPRTLKMTDNCQYAEIVKTRNEELRQGKDGIGEKYTQNIQFSSGTLSHPFFLKSAYDHFSNSDIEGTTFQNRWITVDYIFYSGRERRNVTIEDRLKMVSKYRLLTLKDLNDVTIPNSKWGSDHFSLIVKFSLE